MHNKYSRWINTVVSPNFSEELPYQQDTIIRQTGAIADPTFGFLFVPTKLYEESNIYEIASVLFDDTGSFSISSGKPDNFSSPDAYFEYISVKWQAANDNYFASKIPFRRTSYQLSLSDLNEAKNYIVEQHLDILKFVWENDYIVLERSPPKLESLGAILKDAPGIAIGAYVGIQSGMSYPPIMLITVPTGIILCGAAFGVACALRDGLRARITELTSKSSGDHRPEPEATASDEDEGHEAAARDDDSDNLV